MVKSWKKQIDAQKDKLMLKKANWCSKNQIDAQVHTWPTFYHFDAENCINLKIDAENCINMKIDAQAASMWI